MNRSQRFLRPADLGPLLGVTTGRIYQLIAAGEIPSTRVGGTIRIPRSAWDEWVSGHARSALLAVRTRGQSRVR